MAQALARGVPKQLARPRENQGSGPSGRGCGPAGWRPAASSSETRRYVVGVRLNWRLAGPWRMTSHMSDLPPSEAEGRRVAMFVAAVFLTVALIFGGVAGYLLLFNDGPQDFAAVMGGAAWILASVTVALALAARSGKIIGTSGWDHTTSAGASVDPDAMTAQAWAHEGVQWGGEASVPLGEPAPTLFMLASGLTLACAGVGLWWIGRLTIGGVAVTWGIGAFMLYWAWLAHSSGRAA
ncbi:hypothetical protein ACFSCV_10175 [Methylopila henanensis]|uniref:Cytochrome aa3 subunit 4 n=1 Tax=Methylopila henanensis TaxID=873516 RepID=A0ABW4K6R7_9HYPH